MTDLFHHLPDPHMPTGLHQAFRSSLKSQARFEADLNPLTLADLRAALALGWEDFRACRSDMVMLALIFPVAGLLLLGLGQRLALPALIFPLISGFLLLGPLAALGLYEISYRRELGERIGLLEAFGVLQRPAIASVGMMGLILIGLFGTWLAAAWGLHTALLDEHGFDTLPALLRHVLTSPQGHKLIALGCGLGGLFAMAVLALSVVTFPMLIDRRSGLGVAMRASLRLTLRSPVAVIAWGAIVAVTLALAIMPMLLGLVVVMPWLGHATWHLYRRAVV